MSGWLEDTVLKTAGCKRLGGSIPSFSAICSGFLELYESESQLAKGVRLQNVLMGVQIPPGSPKPNSRGKSRACGIVAEPGLLHLTANEENISSAGSNPADSAIWSESFCQVEHAVKFLKHKLVSNDRGSRIIGTAWTKVQILFTPNFFCGAVAQWIEQDF
jgi:hypothetical protein